MNYLLLSWIQYNLYHTLLLPSKSTSCVYFLQYLQFKPRGKVKIQYLVTVIKLMHLLFSSLRLYSINNRIMSTFLSWGDTNVKVMYPKKNKNVFNQNNFNKENGNIMMDFGFYSYRVRGATTQNLHSRPKSISTIWVKTLYSPADNLWAYTISINCSNYNLKIIIPYVPQERDCDFGCMCRLCNKNKNKRPAPALYCTVLHVLYHVTNESGLFLIRRGQLQFSIVN